MPPFLKAGIISPNSCVPPSITRSNIAPPFFATLAKLPSFDIAAAPFSVLFIAL